MLDNKEEMEENLIGVYELQGNKTTNETTDTLLLSAILAELQEIKYMLFANFDDTPNQINWNNTESV